MLPTLCQFEGETKQKTTKVCYGRGAQTFGHTMHDVLIVINP